MLKLLHVFEQNRLFTEAEAWMLFRIAAFGEAVGWTLLILGILIKRYVMHGDGTAVTIAGQIHGMIFFGYLVAAIGLYPNLGWSRWRAVVALVASVPPYGSLIMEWWGAYTRKNAGFKSYRHFLIYNVFITAA